MVHWSIGLDQNQFNFYNLSCFLCFNVFGGTKQKFVSLLQRSSDTAVLLTKNEIKAVKKMVFSVVRRTMKIEKIKTEFQACSIDLSSVLVWAIREQCLLSSDQETMEFNIKIDGRPLGGIASAQLLCLSSFIAWFQERSISLNSNITLKYETELEFHDGWCD